MTREQEPAQPDAATHSDIADRLAAAADGIDVGTAPYQAVLRGGRRRKTRRWVVGALAAVALAGSTGSLALAVVDGREQTQVASEGGSARERHVYTPQFTTLTEVFDEAGTPVTQVELQVWGAPRDESEAAGQRKAMIKAGVWDERTTDPVPNFDQPWYAISVRPDGRHKQRVTSFGLQDKEPGGDDGLSFASVEFDVKGKKLTIGHVGPKTKRVEFEYENGTTEPELHKAAGSAYLWFSLEEADPGPDGELRAVRLYDGRGKVEVVQEN
ncbi:hypothetical protein ACIBKX_03220 [Streptomyces sp. NPDC050658]|uniref:hypothetical protein n=1 Tax=unclassified Streptomyces TaxID=2593676 RepID=UPI0034426E6D